MVRTIISLSVVLFFFLNVDAQKKDKETIGTIQYVQYPEKPLSLDYKTYKVIAKSSYSDPYRRDEMLKLTSLYGYEKMDSETEEKTHLVIELEEYPRQTGESEYKTKKTVVKKDGVESTVTTYYVVNSFKYKYTISLSDSNGTIFEKALEGTQNVTGDDGKNYEEARAKYNKEMESQKNEVLKSCVSSLVSSCNDLHGFPIKLVSLYAYKIKPKKYNYDEFNDAWSKVNTSVEESNSSEQDVTSFESNLKEAIEAYSKDLEEMDIDDKKARVNKDVAAAAYYNICLSYFLLKDYEKALDSLKKGREIDNGIGNANIMNSILTKMIERTKIYEAHKAS